MSEQEPKDPGADEGKDGEDGPRGARERMSDGFQRGLGVLSAFKEALDQTISEARERGDLSVDRARDAMKSAVDRAREATSDAKERFDFATVAEFEALEHRVRELEKRMGLSETPDDGEGPSEGGPASSA
ncbi:MAG TPA: hypothetical protein VK858_00655 [Longimicrobiales bacterium]|nr:hypothetical protein [Longimicrobiales bacterium]